MKQVGNSPVIEIDRSFGQREDSYEIVCFTDASKDLYGCVLFMRNLSSGKFTFLLAKNKVINEHLRLKSMPVLELTGMHLGVQALMDVLEELQSTLRPIKITNLRLFTDSTISLSWVKALVSHLDKMSGKSVFIMNKLESIRKMCKTHQVEFGCIPGLVNPANWTTRQVSGKLLVKSCYHSGPPPTQMESLDCRVLVPNPIEVNVENAMDCTDLHTVHSDPLFSWSRYTSFNQAVNVVKCCFKYLYKLKLSLKKRDPEKYSHLEPSVNGVHEKSCLYVIRESQKESFQELFNYLESKSKRQKDIPELVAKLNVFIDGNGLIRVKSKMSNLKADFQKYPLLLHKSHPITKPIIWDLHVKKRHSGIYPLLNDLWEEFWILQYYSAVKNVLKHCVWCKRQNARTIKTNVNAYKEFRVNPDSIPFRDIMLDHIGPFSVKNSGKTEKVWVLIITCLYSRAVSLNICLSLDISSFLRAFQMHILRYGLPKLTLSDPGSSIVSGVNVVMGSYYNLPLF